MIAAELLVEIRRSVPDGQWFRLRDIADSTKEGDALLTLYAHNTVERRLLVPGGRQYEYRVLDGEGQ